VTRGIAANTQTNAKKPDNRQSFSHPTHFRSMWGLQSRL
jgi:hypothetical protein